MFFVLIALAFGADKLHSMGEKKKEGLEEPLMGEKPTNAPDKNFGKYQTDEFYNELCLEKLGQANLDKDSIEKREEMKAMLREKYGTDDIEAIKKEQIDALTKGNALIPRLNYRKGAGGLRKMEISKGQKYEKQELSAENLGAEYKNSDFGFQCLHYSVSEAKGKMQIPILNKSRNECRVRVKTLGMG